MKSLTTTLVTGLTTLAASTSLAQSSYPAVETVTVTAACQPTKVGTYGPIDTGAPTYNPGQNSQYYPGQNTDSVVTVTVTERPATVTITTAVAFTNTVSYVGAGVPTVTHVASLPPYEPENTAATHTYADTHTDTTSAYGAKQTHHVNVGTFNEKFQFVPDRVNAEVGDIVLYNFLKQSHSLTQSEFLTPCTPNGGFDTGLNQVNPTNTSGLFLIPFEVKTEKPQWFYCKQKQGNHCGKGMVFGLNPGDKMDRFIQNAILQNGNSTGAGSPTATSVYSSPTGTATSAIPTVTVGIQNGTVLKFDPPFLPKVAIGQKIHFDFRAANHTLTESSLADPCTKLAGTTVDTNFQNANKADIPELKPFDLVIDSDRPRYFYCKQGNKAHCAKGMVFSVNTDEATFRQFEANAKAVAPTLKIKGRAFTA
ncbi:hypothetical protein MMC31_000780 [Peltigera leucophlebia]|nr:hypothetical protein [Peltigera leucophlebia]